MRSEHANLAEEVQRSTGRLLHDVGMLDEDAADRSTLCSGWTAKHVLTHLARNSDGLVNLLVWARTGVVTPMYPDQATRDEEISLGAQRPLADIAVDLEDSARRFDAEVAAMPDVAWSATVHPGPAAAGPAMMARDVLWRRLVELELHHVDLDGPYTAAHWPEGFAEALLEETAERFTGRNDVPSLRVTAVDTGWTATFGQDPHPQVVEGPTRAVAAWLTGRSSGDGLHARTAAGHLTAPPPLPAWG